MARPKAEGPTEREFDILQVIWTHGPSTARCVATVLNEARTKKIAYNSVLTIMSIMHTKGLLSRSEVGRGHLYAATYSRYEIEDKFVTQMIDDVFGGSAMRLVSRALSVRATSDEEAEKIRQLLDELGEGQDD